MPKLLIVTAIALFGLGPGHQTVVSGLRAYQLGKWRLEVRRNAFTQTVQCQLSNDYGRFPDLVARQTALVVKLGGRRDGAAAWFSVDGAPARPWRDLEAALIAKGALAQAERLDNETGAELPLPYSAIFKARTLSIQIKDLGPIRTYRLGRLWDVLGSANALGCGYDI